MAAILLGAAASPARASGTDGADSGKLAAGSPAIRAMAPYVRRLIREGIRRSPTFAAEVRELATSNVIAIIEPSRTLPSGICGHMVFMTARGGVRYIQILFDTRYNLPQTIGILGHELRHALEVAAHPEVVDQASLRRMYSSIGYRNPSRWDEAYDSAEAIATGHTVVAEMLAPIVNADADEAASGR